MDIAWNDLWTAVALMLVIEGVMPFVNPASFRQMLQMVAQMEPGKIRMMGAFWMGMGLLVLYWVRG